MFEHFTTLEEIYCYKLALALTMLQGSIDALDTLEETAMRSDLEDLFRDSAHATRHQLQNLQGCFSLPDQNTNDAPSAAAKGLNRETNARIAKTDSTLVDAVLLAGALEAAHHEGAAELVTRAYEQIQAEVIREPEPVIQVPSFLPTGSI